MNRTYWVIGDTKIFRLSKNNCQRLLAAIVASEARLEGSDSFSFYKTYLNNTGKAGELIEGITLGRADAAFSVSIPAGNEEIFDRWMGGNYREEPLEITGRRSDESI